jgi:hypothetical protein
MKIFFSASTLGFYDYTLFEVYKNSGSGLPEDIVELTESELNDVYVNHPPAGMVLSSSSGRPVFVEKMFTPEELELKQRNDARELRTKLVDSIIVTTSSGKTFDGDETSQTRMARAILVMQATQSLNIQWKLSNNTVEDITLAELSEALTLAGIEQTKLWMV